MTDKGKKSHSTDIKKDNDLWIEVMRDVLPLKDRHEVNIQKKPFPSKSEINIEIPVARNTYTPEVPKSSEVDYRTQLRLKRGKMQIDGRIDLHGMTQNQAYDALLSFIPHAHSLGKRCVLVITGKGENRTSNASLFDGNIGVLKQKTPEWLNNSPLVQYVLKIETARPNHGGEGALYVLLRRKRG